MPGERIVHKRRVIADPSGRVELTEQTTVISQHADTLKKFVRSRTKKEALTDQKKPMYPPGVLRSLRVVLPEALSLGGEDEEPYKVTQQQKAEFSVKEACLNLIKANKGLPIVTRAVAEELVHSNLTYQRQKEFGIPSDIEEGWVSDTETALLSSWPTSAEIDEFLNEAT